MRGMREGGWRRMVVPAAYGEAGLRKVTALAQDRPSIHTYTYPCVVFICR